MKPWLIHFLGALMVVVALPLTIIRFLWQFSGAMASIWFDWLYTNGGSK